MKFTCEKCMTKYSISDERVAGKVLKIRCKKCSTIIEVSDPNLAAPEPREPTAEPAAEQSVEEEWYLSIDGDQAGPFNLADARIWLTRQPSDAEFFCWVDGFDDWKAVDSVAEFADISVGTSAGSDEPRAETSDSLFEVGEVSRVVKLGDLVPTQPPQLPQKAKKTAMLDSADIPVGEMSPAYSGYSRPTTITGEGSNRIGIALAIIGAVVIVAVGAAILQLRGSDETPPPQTVDKAPLATDDLGRKIESGGLRADVSSSSSKSSTTKTTKATSSRTLTTIRKTQITSTPSTGAVGEPLTPNDIQQKSRRSQFTFTRCFERAKKRDPFLKVSKMQITLKVDPSGKVSSASLSKLGDHYLGKCLLRSVKRWKFRETKAGIKTRFPIVFQNN